MGEYDRTALAHMDRVIERAIVQFQTFRHSVFLRFIYDLFECCYFFLFESLCIQQDKTTRHLGIIFSKISKNVFLIFNNEVYFSRPGHTKDHHKMV